MAYAILRTAKLTTNGNISASIAHNNRERECKNVNPELTPKNEYIVKSTLEEIVSKTDPYMARKDNVRVVELVLTASPEFFSTADEQKVQEWKQANIEYLQKTFGKENIVNLVLHRDERTPHIHAHVTPIAEKEISKKRTKEEIASGEVGSKKKVKMLSAKEWLGDRSKLRKMQNEYAKAMEGFGLERGKEHNQVHHKTLKEYYSITSELPNLQKQIDEAKAIHEFLNISSDEVEKAKEKIAKDWEEVNKRKEEIALLKKEIGDMTLEKERLKDGIESLTSETSLKQRLIDDVQKDLEKVVLEKDKLDDDVRSLTSQISDITNQIQEKTKVLDKVKQDFVEYEKSTKEIHEKTDVIFEKVKNIKENAKKIPLTNKAMIDIDDYRFLVRTTAEATKSNASNHIIAEKATKSLKNAEERIEYSKTYAKKLEGENEALKAEKKEYTYFKKAVLSLDLQDTIIQKAKDIYNAEIQERKQKEAKTQEKSKSRGFSR